MKKNVMITFIVLVLMISGSLACSHSNNEVQSTRQEIQETAFEAVILEISDTYLLVEPIEGSSELNSADQITVPMTNMNVSSELEVGDIIEIKYNSEIAESYPAQITEIYSIKMVKEAIKEDDDEMESEDEETTEIQMGENEVTGTAVVSPLPTTIDLNNIRDCTLAVSIENGDIYASEADAAKYTMKVKIYDYELFDLVDISLLEVGSIIVINKELVEVVSLERNELGTVIINGGLDAGGYKLVTDGYGVFYSV